MLTVAGRTPQESDSEGVWWAGHSLGNGTRRGARGKGKVQDWPEERVSCSVVSAALSGMLG